MDEYVSSSNNIRLFFDKNGQGKYNFCFISTILGNFIEIRSDRWTDYPYVHKLKTLFFRIG